jgi:hypothetical protein
MLYGCFRHAFLRLHGCLTDALLPLRTHAHTDLHADASLLLYRSLLRLPLCCKLEPWLILRVRKESSTKKVATGGLLSRSHILLECVAKAGTRAKSVGVRGPGPGRLAHDCNRRDDPVSEKGGEILGGVGGRVWYGTMAYTRSVCV